MWPADGAKMAQEYGSVVQFAGLAFLNTYSGDVRASLDRSGSRRLCPWVALLLLAARF